MLIMSRLPVVLLCLMALPLSQAIVIESDDTVQEMTTDKPGNSESGDFYTGLESGQGSGDSSRQDDLESGDSSESDDLESGDSSGLESGDSSGLESGDSSGLESGDSSDLESGDSSDLESGDSSGLESGDSSGLESGDSSGLESGDSSDLESGDSSGLESGDSSDLESGDSSDLESGDSSDLESGDSSDLESGSGSKSGHVEVPKRHPLEWVEHTRGGDTIFADHSDIESISEFVSSSPTASSTCYTSQRPKVAYDDGPLNTVNSDNDEGTRHKRFSPSVFRCRKKTQGVRHHPEYAVGLLDNGCTAFLVGPHHAMTSAMCVYDHKQKSWKEDLDFWRGRNSSGYLQRMEWERVIIPRLFFDTKQKSSNWAIVTFKKSHPSPVWVPFEFCEGNNFGSKTDVTMYGYMSDDQYFSRCAITSKRLSCWCPRYYALSSLINGGPILIAYHPDSKIDKQHLPPAIGISYNRGSSHSGGYSHPRDQKAFTFGADTFWSACFLLANNGFEANCQKSYEVPQEKSRVHTYKNIVVPEVDAINKVDYEHFYYLS